MALTQYYADYGAGNDYIGATFNDGAFANATLTLTKAGAFGATRVNHWLYLDDNGSGEVTPGYYRVTDVSGAPNAVVLHADIRSGANDPTDVVCIQADGSASLPFRSVQGALDLITRNAANGDQINIVAGTAQMLEASLALDKYGTPDATGGLALCGCTAVADDGGMGEIVATGAWAIINADAVNKSYLIFKDLILGGTTSGSFALLQLESRSDIVHCRFNMEASGGGRIKFGVHCPAGASKLIRVRDSEFVEYGESAVALSQDCHVIHNHMRSSSPALGVAVVFDQVDGSAVLNNIIRIMTGAPVTASGVSVNSGQLFVSGNAIYSEVASTSAGVRAVDVSYINNNIICGFSGAGGSGIGTFARNPRFLGNNAFWNCTTNIDGSPDLPLGTDVQLLADPFTDAANGDFSLTAAAKAALADAGWPTEYLGAHANTVPHLNIGPIQMDAASGGGGGGVSRIIGG